MNKDGSAWSQPYKLVLGVIAVALLGVLVFKVDKLTTTRNLGIAGDQINYPFANATSTQCFASTSSLVAAANTGRTSFLASNNSTNTIYLCKTATTSLCSASTGIPLVATTTGPGGAWYEQTDGYTGGYSCISALGSSTLGLQRAP